MRKFLLLMLTSCLFTAHALANTVPTPPAHSKISKANKCLFPKSREIAPDWVCKKKDEKLAVSAVGYSAKSRAGPEFMKDMAAADARNKLANRMHESVRRKIADKDEIKGKAPNKAAIEKLTQANLEGTKILKTAYAPRGGMYVLVGLDKAGAEKLYDEIAADYLKWKE